MIYLLMGIAFAVALCFTLISVPLARKIAEKIGAIDVPKDTRRMHKVPTPRLGGLAVFLGFLVSVLCFCEITKETIGLLCGSVIIVILGIFDDSHDLSAKLKLIVQIIAALVTIYIGDIKINFFTNPNIFSNDKILLLSDWISVPCTVLWIVAITNAVNLIDGLDGLAAGVSTIAAVSLVFIASMVDEPAIALIAIIIAGACLGFLPFNFRKKKKIFLGDTGATFLGYALAVLSVQGGFKSYAVISFAVPVLIFGLPIFDTAFAMLRRMLTGAARCRRPWAHPSQACGHGLFTEAERVYPVRDERCFGSYGGCACRERRNARPAFAYGVLIVIFTGSLFTKNRRRAINSRCRRKR